MTLVSYASSDEESIDAREDDQQQTLTSNGDTIPRRNSTNGPVSVHAKEEDQPMPTVARPPDSNKALSPISTNRALIQSLTMPPVPNFDIPSSPRSPSPDSEEAANLRTTTRKFEKFLELKKQGVHFNDRLATSKALSNPGALSKLLQFAGFDYDDQYRNTLGEDFGVPMSWPDGFLQELLKDEKRERQGKRTKVDFVSARRAGGEGM